MWRWSFDLDKSDSVHVRAPGSIVSVDPPTDLACESEVSVIADDNALLDMEGHETSVRFGLLPTQMCVLVYTDSALYNAEADSDEEGSDDEWLAKAKKGIRVRFQHDVLVCVVAQDDPKKTIWFTSGTEASACRDALDLAEYMGAVGCQFVARGEVLPDE